MWQDPNSTCPEPKSAFCSHVSSSSRLYNLCTASSWRLLLDFLLPSASYWQSTSSYPLNQSPYKSFSPCYTLHIELSWCHRQLDFMMESSLAHGRIAFMIWVWQARLLHLLHPWPNPHPMATTAFKHRVKLQASCTSSVQAHYPTPSNHLYFCHFI